MSIEREKWITIPVEVKPRDLIPHFLLGCFAVDAGFKVMLGEENVVNAYIDMMPKGISFEKSISPHKLPILQQRHNLGHCMVCSDAESLSFLVDAQNARIRMSEETLPLTKRYYCWNEAQAAISTSAFPQHGHRFITTGTPRFDQLREEFAPIFDERAHGIRSRFGKFILLMSNFAPGISSQGPYFHAQQLKLMGVGGEKDLQLLKILQDHTRAMIMHFIDLLRAIETRYPSHPIVIRPHPADDHNFWHYITHSLKQTHVIYEGTSLDWIAAAELILHNGCTTGLEAAVMKAPTITYMPIISELCETHPSNSISTRACTQDEALEQIGSILGGDAKSFTEKPFAKMEAMISALEGPFACENIMQDLSQLDWEASFDAPRTPLAIENRLKKETLPENNKKYNQQKFEGLQLKELETLHKQLSRVHPTFKSIRIREIAPYWFEMS